MHNGFKRLLHTFIFAGVLSLALISDSPKSQAACCGGTAQEPTSQRILGVSNSIKEVADKIWAEVQKIVPALIGSPGNFPWQFDDTVNGFTRNTAIPEARAGSIVQYFETVYWPRMLAMNKKIKQQDAETTGLEMTNAIQIQEGQNVLEHARDIQRFNANSAVGGLGLDTNGCPTATRWGPMVSSEIIANANTREAIRESLAKAGGSSDFPEAANGLVNYYRSELNNRISSGLCDPKGNNGADKEWCTQSENENIADADANPQSLVESPTLSKTNKEIPNHVDYVKGYINSMFPSVFSAIRAENLKGNSNLASEVLFNRATYKSQISTFRRPFEQESANREPIDGLDPQILSAYKAALEDIGIKENTEVQKMFLDAEAGNMSRNAFEKVQYRMTNQNPSEVARQASYIAANPSNGLLTMVMKAMDTVVMLYDIREEQRETNRLLGAIGSMMAVERHDVIEKKIQAISSSGG